MSDLTGDPGVLALRDGICVSVRGVRDEAYGGVQADGVAEEVGDVTGLF